MGATSRISYSSDGTIFSVAVLENMDEILVLMRIVIAHLFEVTEFSSPNPLEAYTCSECSYYYFSIFPYQHCGSLLYDAWKILDKIHIR